MTQPRKILIERLESGFLVSLDDDGRPLGGQGRQFAFSSFFDMFGSLTALTMMGKMPIKPAPEVSPNSPFPDSPGSGLEAIRIAAGMDKNDDAVWGPVRDD